MNKDFELKNDPQYQMRNLRGRINESIKRLRDEGEEMELPQAKSLPPIPVTGAGGRPHKYLSNKSRKQY